MRDIRGFAGSGRLNPQTFARARVLLALFWICCTPFTGNLFVDGGGDEPTTVNGLLSGVHSSTEERRV